MLIYEREISMAVIMYKSILDVVRAITDDCTAFVHAFSEAIDVKEYRKYERNRDKALARSRRNNSNRKSRDFHAP